MHSTGDRVTWREGRHQRLHTGVVENVQQATGWPAEYYVRLIRKSDGALSTATRRKFESELEREA